MRKSFSLRASVLLTLVLAFVLALPALAQNSANKPVPRTDEWWQKRHASFNERVAQGNADLIFIGDSITQGWEGAGEAVWEKFYGGRNAVNLGISGDRTQHVLWRLDNGNINGISPKLAVIMIGTNNVKDNTAGEIAGAIGDIVRKLRAKLPQMKILLLDVFPREEKPGEFRAKLEEVNKQIAELNDGQHVFFLDIGDKFTEPDGTLPKSVMPDFLHPNKKGYEIWAEAIEAKVSELLGE